jgi:hypothetical protein
MKGWKWAICALGVNSSFKLADKKAKPHKGLTQVSKAGYGSPS